MAAIVTGWDDQGREWTRTVTAASLVANFASSLTAPAKNATVAGTVTIEGLGRYDAETAVESIAFYVDGALRLTDRTSPFSYAWPSTGVANGTHVLRVRTTLNDGRQLFSGEVPVVVDN